MHILYCANYYLSNAVSIGFILSIQISSCNQLTTINYCTNHQYAYQEHPCTSLYTVHKYTWGDGYGA